MKGILAVLILHYSWRLFQIKALFQRQTQTLTSVAKIHAHLCSEPSVRHLSIDGEQILLDQSDIWHEYAAATAAVGIPPPDAAAALLLTGLAGRSPHLPAMSQLPLDPKNDHPKFQDCRIKETGSIQVHFMLRCKVAAIG